jgi:KDO2-lipid IV(A) lauroyltransferase
VASALADKAVVAAFKAGNVIAGRTPLRVARPLISASARIAPRMSPTRRLIVERNLRRVRGDDLGGRELDAAVTATFESYARYYFDSFRLTSMSVADVDAGFTVEGLHHLEAALDNDPVGPILALPHLGGWEWAAYWISQVKGWKIAAVVEELSPPELFEWFLDFRTSIGLNIIPVGPDAVEAITEAVADGQIMCLLCDRDLTGGGVPVTFFGEETTLPAGPAVMALRGGCALLPTAVYFSDDGVHGVVRPPLTIERDPDATSIRGDVARLTQALAGELEELIRAAPEEWHLLQPNWPSDLEAIAARAKG